MEVDSIKKIMSLISLSKNALDSLDGDRKKRYKTVYKKLKKKLSDMGLNKKQLQTIFENMKIYSEKTDKITTINKLQETGFYHFLKTSKP